MPVGAYGRKSSRIAKCRARLCKMCIRDRGTIYPDVVESGTGQAAVIKSHHNVGGLPEDIGFEGLVEPLRDLFKDEVRRVGLELSLIHI